MNNLVQYSGSLKPTRALLSIRPKFAEAIIRGEKKFEFRRNMFAKRVDVVLVYATVPIRKVVAEFDVRSVINESLPILWQLTHRQAGINREYFFNYFQGKEYGFAIEIGNVRPYEFPFCPIKELGIYPPQSFVYLEKFLGK